MPHRNFFFRGGSMSLFKVLGVVLLLYVVYGVSVGQIYAKRGIWGATIKRDEQPVGYWSTVTVYTALSIALVFFF